MNPQHQKLIEELIEAGTPARLTAQVASLATEIAHLIAQVETEEKILLDKREKSREYTKRWREKQPRNLTKSHVRLRDLTSDYPPRAYTTPPEEVDSSLRSLSTPPVTQGAAEGKKTRVKTSMPEDHALSEKDRGFAAAQGWPAARIASEFARFCDHARANNRKQADWHAAWRNWVTSPYQRSETMNGNHSKSVADVFAELSERESADPCWVLPQIGRG